MIRRHPITGAPILFVPARAERPGAFGEETVDRCPFCPGHESDTPPTITQTGDPWRVRVFANKYPSVEGAEVIVESPRHEPFASIEHAEEVVRMYVARIRAHADATYTCLFKNEGPRAGASIAHVHSQVMPLDFVPPRIAAEREGFARAASCPLCTMDAHVIRETSTFRWLCPAGSSMPYQQWIVPVRHVSLIAELRDEELADLASLLRVASAATLQISESYNWMLLQLPHMYIDVVPRVTAIAGFELGTGTFVEIIDPADAAQRLA